MKLQFFWDILINSYDVSEDSGDYIFRAKQSKKKGRCSRKYGYFIDIGTTFRRNVGNPLPVDTA